MDQEEIDKTIERITGFARSPDLMLLLSLITNVSTVDILVGLASAKEQSDLLTERREAMIARHKERTGRDLGFGHPDHEIVHDLTVKAQALTDQAFTAAVEAVATTLVLNTSCECPRCQARRQKARAQQS